MSKSKYTSDSSGLDMLDVLALIFISLKFIGVIDWSWWAVLSPWWIQVAVFVIIALAAWIDSW